MSEPIKVECSVDFDDEWIQEDCHWDYKRFFIITWKIWSGPLTNISTGDIIDGKSYSTKKLFYRIGSSDIQALPNYYKTTTNNAAKWNDQCTRKLETFTYILDFSSLSDEVLLNAVGDESWLPISAFVLLDGATEALGTAINNYYLEMPPKALENITLTRKSADRIVCSWKKAEPTIESGASVAGYMVELFCKKKGTDSFKQISDLAVSKEADGYKLVRATGELPEEYTFADASTIKEEDDLTFIGCGDKLEAFIDDPNATEFYFRPRDFEVATGNIINKDDDFQIVVYPYIVYGSYIEGQEVKQGTLLAAAGTDSDVMKFKLGVVRVKTEGGWVEGQVWAMVDDGTGKGKWVEVDSVYTMVDDGTGKGVWKEAM